MNKKGIEIELIGWIILAIITIIIALHISGFFGETAKGFLESIKNFLRFGR